MPGLIDAHGHMESLGASQEELDLRGVARSRRSRGGSRRGSTRRPGDSWITGRNWDQSLWPGGAFPTAAVLDAVAPGRPVWLKRVDGHAGWANSEAMRRAKVTKDSQAPADGQIIRDAAGQPTGVFIDGAMGLVGRAVPAPTKADLKRRLLAAQELVLQSGPDRRPRRRDLAARRPRPIASSTARASSWSGSTAWPRLPPEARSRS